MKYKELYKITHFKEIDSTSGYAMRNLQSLFDKQVIVSDIQTSGKGRMNRKWVSDKLNNIYMSIVLKPCNKVNKNKDLPLSSITQYMSVIVCKTLENYGVETEIKWPNDVLIEGKKISGILCQSSMRGNNLNGLVLGVGVNLNLSQEDVNNVDQLATALNLLTRSFIDRDSFLENLLDNFFEEYDTFMDRGFPFIMKDYIHRSHFFGKIITLKTPNSTEMVTALKIREDGALIIQDSNLRKRTVTAGEIVIGA